jgi:glycosyltransferase involved in cell wall biosynthesis
MVEHLLPGGAERMSVNISNVLSENGYKVVLCTTRANGELLKYVKSDVKHFCLNKRHTLDFQAFFKLTKAIRKYRIKIIHAHSSSLYWAVGCKLFFPKIKIIWHDHDGNSELLSDSSRRDVKYLSVFVARIVAVNQTLVRWSLRNTYLSEDKICYLRNFPVLSFINTSLRSNLSEMRILCLANLRPQKDHLNLLRALVILVHEMDYNFIKLDLAGIYFEDQYFEEIKNFVKQNKLESNVNFLGSVTEIISLLERADLGVLSSISEGLPVSLLEYGLAELPVVVTNVGQCSEVVKHGELGTVVPPMDPISFANAVAWHIQNRAASIQMGSEFKKHIEMEYGAIKFVKEYGKLLVGI